MSLFEARELRKSFGGVQALDGVSLRVEPGELVALIGPNGAGKSTFFNVVDGQLAPDEGSVLFDGADITGAAPQALFRRGIGRTFQVARVFGSMTALQNLQTAFVAAARLRGPWRDATRLFVEPAMAELARVGLAARADVPAAALAYGEVKRLELALALASRPRLLLMDEPAAGLGAGERGALMELIGSIVAEERLAVLFTEHSMDVVFGHAARIVVLARGRVIAEGPPAVIADDPQVRAVYLGSLRIAPIAGRTGGAA